MNFVLYAAFAVLAVALVPLLNATGFLKRYKENEDAALARYYGHPIAIFVVLTSLFSFFIDQEAATDPALSWMPYASVFISGLFIALWWMMFRQTLEEYKHQHDEHKKPSNSS